MVHVGVIGAGVVGLSAAVNVQKLMPDARVTLIADKFGHEIVSHGAGGFFRPYLDDMSGSDPEMIKQWVTDSWYFYSGLASSAQAKESGALFVSGMLVYKSPQDKAYSLLSSLVRDWQVMTEEQLAQVKLNHRYSHGYAFTTVTVQPPKYLPWLTKQFQEAGGRIEQRNVRALSDLYGEFDVVVNCCGLRAEELVRDCNMFPVKGHLLRVRAPWIKNFFLAEDDIYIFPHEDVVLIGGLKDKGNSDMTPDPAVRQRIFARAKEVVPQLAGAEFVNEWVGLRPGRSTIRFETEVVNCGSQGKLMVVHNYGHGGHGITLGWGAGIGVARLVQDLIRSHRSRL